MKLSQKEIARCKEAFEHFDKVKAGKISVWQLRNALKYYGKNPSGEELRDMMTAVEDEGSGYMTFDEFVKVVQNQKNVAERRIVDDDSTTKDAFVALGGNPDSTGEIDLNLLRRTAKVYGLTVDIEELIREYDEDQTGYIDYLEFKQMMVDFEKDRMKRGTKLNLNM